MTMMNFISHGTQDMYPTFLQTQRGTRRPDTANLTMLAKVGAILGGLVFGYYSDRAGPPQGDDDRRRSARWSSCRSGSRRRARR